MLQLTVTFSSEISPFCAIRNWIGICPAEGAAIYSLKTMMVKCFALTLVKNLKYVYVQ